MVLQRHGIVVVWQEMLQERSEGDLGLPSLRLQCIEPRREIFQLHPFLRGERWKVEQVQPFSPFSVQISDWSCAFVPTMRVNLACSTTLASRTLCCLDRKSVV